VESLIYQMYQMGFIKGVDVTKNRRESPISGKADLSSREASTA